MGERDSRLYGTPEVAVRVLDHTTTWFVVGLGNNPDRDAYAIARLLQSRGKRIVPIYPRAEVVHGEQGYATIAEAAAAVGAPDVVDLFVRSDRAGVFVDEAIEAGARASSGARARRGVCRVPGRSSQRRASDRRRGRCGRR
jgi:predicted CoA-binding protein